MEQENRLKKKIIKWTMIFLGVVLVFIIMRWIRPDEAAFGLCTRNKKCQPPILL